MSQTVRIPRESQEWVGPITVTKLVAGAPVPVDPASVTFAVLPRRQRPTEDWADFHPPYLDPDGTGALGVWCTPVTGYQDLGIWARFPDTPEVPVLEPAQVGYITRS